MPAVALNDTHISTTAETDGMASVNSSRASAEERDMNQTEVKTTVSSEIASPYNGAGMSSVEGGKAPSAGCESVKSADVISTTSLKPLGKAAPRLREKGLSITMHVDPAVLMQKLVPDQILLEFPSLSKMQTRAEVETRSSDSKSLVPKARLCKLSRDGSEILAGSPSKPKVK